MQLMKEKEKLIKNLDNNDKIVYSLFDKENTSYCLINKNLNFSVKIQNNCLILSTISPNTTLPQYEPMENEGLQLGDKLGDNGCCQNKSYEEMFSYLSNEYLNLAGNIGEYLSYIKNFLIDNNKLFLYHNFFHKEFKENFPSFLYEYEMIRKKHNVENSLDKNKSLKQKFR